MVKKTLLFTLIALIGVAVLSASGVSEQDKLLEAAKDSLIVKKPLSREADYERYNLNGDIVETKDAKGIYKWEKTAKRTIEGDKEIFSILDSIYDGILYTPLTNSKDHISCSVSYAKESTINEKAVSVYNFKITVDQSVLFYETLTASGEITIKYEIGIYNEDAKIAYQIAKFSLDEVDYKQTATYKNGVPIEIVTEGYSDKINTYALIHDIENFKITKTITY